MDDKEKLEIIDRLKEEREISNKQYAIKLAEFLIFGLCGILLIGAVGAIMKLVIIQ